MRALLRYVCTLLAPTLRHACATLTAHGHRTLSSGTPAPTVNREQAPPPGISTGDNLRLDHHILVLDRDLPAGTYDPADRLERTAEHVGKLLCQLAPCEGRAVN